MVIVNILARIRRTWRLYASDMSREIRENRISMIWVFINPIVPMIFYALLASIRIFPSNDEIQRITYVCFGVCFWLLFTEIINTLIRQLRVIWFGVKNENLSVVAQLSVPLLRVLIDFAIRFFVALSVVFLIAPEDLSYRFDFFVFVLAGCFSFIGFGLILAVVCLAFGNFRNIVSIFLQYGIFVSGVIFPLPFRIQGFMEVWNPLFIFVDVLRGSVTQAVSASPHMIWVSILGMVCLAIGLRSVRLLERSYQGNVL